MARRTLSRPSGSSETLFGIIQWRRVAACSSASECNGGCHRFAGVDLHRSTAEERESGREGHEVDYEEQYLKGDQSDRVVKARGGNPQYRRWRSAECSPSPSRVLVHDLDMPLASRCTLLNGSRVSGRVDGR